MKKPIITLSIILISFSAFAQNRKIQRAFETYKAEEYFTAIDYFKDAYESTLDKDIKLDITFYIAECYRHLYDPANAERWFSKVVNRNYKNPIAILYYADALKMNQKYEEAKIQYRAYKELVPGDERAQNGLISCDLALEWIEYPTGYVVENMRYFNSRDGDYSPCFGSGDYREVFFTSTREETSGKAEHGGSGQGFSDIFVSSQDRKGKWSTPVPLEEPINTIYEEGAPSMSSDFNTMYFTRCEKKKKIAGCEIYSATRKGNEWTNVEPLKIASDTVVVAHPAISPDGLTLFFVSDMEGSIETNEGVKSKDIWKITRGGESSDWGEPINLGEPINTSADEVFPYMHADGTLYFSSNGHIGMGGLDIFKAVKNDAGMWEVENLKYPLNSSVDDFGIVFEDKREAGFLSSTRRGRRNDDIYSFLLPPLKFNISGVVKNEKTDELIPDATVKLIGSDGITMENQTGIDGSFKFMLKPNTDYVFIASKDKFLKGKERETTKGLNESIEFETEIYIHPIDIPIEVENIFFDYDDYKLRPESRVSLDNLVETLNDNPNITIELGAHTDARGSAQYNIELSQKRAEEVVNYLIGKGIAANRLNAKGYGKTVPKTVDKKDNEQYPFLPIDTKLTESYINGLEDEDQQEMAHFLNRRTEFKVIRTDYK